MSDIPSDLIVNGAIKITSNINNTPLPGTIRYNPDADEFQGLTLNTNPYNNSTWATMSLSVASSSKLGGFKVGNNLTITESGILSASSNGVSRKFQKVLIVSQQPDTGDYTSINQCLDLFFGYDFTASTISDGWANSTGGLAGLDRALYPYPGYDTDTGITTRYIVVASPGTYTESNVGIRLPPYISLVGDGRDESIIRINSSIAPGSNNYVVALNEGCEVRSLTIDLYNNNVNGIVSNIVGTSQITNATLEDLRFSSVNNTTAYQKAINLTGASGVLCKDLISDIQLTGPSAFTGINLVNCPDITLNNCGFSVGVTGSANTVVGLSAANSVVSGTNCQFLITQTETAANNTVDIRAVNAMDSDVSLEYSQLSAIGFDGLDANDDDAVQKSRAVYLSSDVASVEFSYAPTVTEPITFVHYDDKSQFDEIMAPLGAIDFATSGVARGKYIKIMSTGLDAQNTGYFKVANVITATVSAVVMSIIQLELDYNLADQNLDTGSVNFKVLKNVFLFATSLQSTNETIYYDTLAQPDSNYCVETARCYTSGEGISVGNSLLVLTQPQRITVGARDCDFLSIADACNSIQDASVYKPYEVLVCPGVYNETRTINVPSYVSLVGSSQASGDGDCTVYFESSPGPAYSLNCAIRLGIYKSTVSGFKFRIVEGLNTVDDFSITGISCGVGISPAAGSSTAIVNCTVEMVYNSGSGLPGMGRGYPIMLQDIANVQLDKVTITASTDGQMANIFGLSCTGCSCLARDLTVTLNGPNSLKLYGVYVDHSSMKVANPQITVSNSTQVTYGYFVTDILNPIPYPSPTVSPYTNTLYGGQIMAYSSDGASVVNAVNVDNNSIVIAYNTAFLGPVKSLNTAGNAAPNSYMRALNSYYLTRDSITGTITASGQMDTNGRENGGTAQNLVLGDAGPVAGNTVVGSNNLIAGSGDTAEYYTGGSHSTILGIHAANKLVSGGNTVVIGFQAANNALDGNGVLIGSEAASNITSGDLSVVIGRSAARDLAIAQRSVLLGSNVMMTGLAANNTIAVGSGTAIGIQSAEDSIFLGTDTATSLHTSSRDIVIGSNTLSGMLTGSDSVIVGTDAVNSLTSAVTSVFIGNQVAQNRTDVSESVIIGYQAALGPSGGLTNTGGNDVIIGSRAAGSLTSGSDSVVIGTGAAPKMTSGSRHVIIGNAKMSGDANTAPAARLTTGNDDIIIGTGSASNLTTGSRVTVIGNESGQQLTTTNDVIILGYGSGNQLNSVQAKSIIIGNESGLVYNGNGAIIIGHGSATNATGDDICIIGNQAGRSVQGARNTFIGNYTAGVSEAVFVLGTDNILVGPNSGYQLTTGSYNVVFGSGVAGAAAGDSLEDGNGNMLIGFQAGKSIIGGSYNVCLGYRAGYSLRNSDRNVIIGNDAAPNLGDDNFNNLILGNEAGYNFYEGSNVVMIGNRSGYNSNTNLECLYIGNFAGYSNETGSQNSYIGNFSGQYASGSRNSAIGERALQRSGTGANNIGIGSNAGRGALAGVNHPDRIIAIGNDAGRDISAGYDDILIGTEAGRSLGAGARSIMIGPYAGSECVNTSNSVFIGVSTSNGVGVGRVTSGQYNLFVGINVGIYNTTGDNNVFMGNKAGYQNTTGANNIAMGQNAGRDLTTGTGHILIGTKVGALDTAPGLGLSTGNNDIIMGYNAGSNCVGTISDAILIGTEAGFNNGVDRSIFIGSRAGRDNSTGAGCIYIGPNAAKESTVSGRNIAIGSNAATAYIDQGSSGQNIFIGDEAVVGLEYGLQNIAIGANVLANASNVNSTIALGFEAGKEIGNRAVAAGGDANRNIIVGYQSASGGDINSDNILIGTQVAQHVDNPVEFTDNLFIGTRAGHNANLSVGSVAIGNANQIGTGGISNLMMATGAGNNVGNDRKKKFATSTVVYGGNTYVWVNCPYDQARYYFQEGDLIRIQNTTLSLDTEIASLVDLAVLNNDPTNPIYTSNCMIVFTEPYLYTETAINAGSEIYSLANLDNENVGNLDQSKASGNSLVGNDAGGELTTGSKNVAFGTNALRNNKIGKYNNILGTEAGYNLISDNSTCIGTRAGYSLDLSNTLTYTSNSIGFDSNTNTVTIPTTIDITEFEFGAVFDISGSTLNDGRYTVQQTDTAAGNIVVQGIPRIESLGVPLNVDSNDIRINSSTFNFINDSANGLGYGVRSDATGNRLYTTGNTTLTILENANVFQISGSKYNDGVYYKDTDPLEYSNSCVVFGTFNREVFDSNVVISTNSINSIDSITSGTSFNDLRPTVPIYAYFGQNKGTYQTITEVSQYSLARPLNNCTLVDATVDNSLVEDNILFSHGYKQSLAVNNSQYSDYYKFNKCQIFDTFSIYDSNNTIYFNNPVTELDAGTTGYYRISGSLANNDILVRLTDVAVDNQTFTYETIVGTANTAINITPSNTNPVYFTRNLLCNLSRSVTETFSTGDLVSIANQHNLSLDIANGKYIVDATDGDNIILAGDQVLPVMYGQLSNMQVTASTPSANLTVNTTIDTVVVNDFSNVSTAYLSNISGHIQSRDLMFQSGTFTPGLEPYPVSFTVNNTTKTITSSIRYVFNKLVAPCMVHIGGPADMMALVVANDYPFNKLVFRATDDLSTVTGTETITFNSVSSYNNYSNLSVLVAGTEYKVLNSTINNDITISPSTATGAISRQSVFIDLAYPVDNYNTNETVLAISAPDDGTFTENRQTPRGIFKHIDIYNSNLSLVYNTSNYLARYEPADKYNNSDLFTYSNIALIGGKRFIFEPSVVDGKYCLNTIGTNQTFADISTSNATYWASANIDIAKTITLPSGRSVEIYGESFSSFKLSQNGYIVFEGANVHTVKWLASDDAQFSIRPGVIGSNVNIKYINDGTSTNGADNVLLINYMTNNGSGYGKSGANNVELRFYMDNTANLLTNSRVIVNYSDSTSNLGSLAQYQVTKYGVRGLESTVNSYDKDSRNYTTVSSLNGSNTTTYYLPGSESVVDMKNALNSNVLVLSRKIKDGIDLEIINDSVSGSKFGTSSSQYGTRLVVGAPGDTMTVRGNAYVYDNMGEYIGYLYSSNVTNVPGAYCKFGTSVAVWEDRIVVGAPSNLSNGSAHIFDWDGTNWINTANLVSTLSNASGFGTACAIYNSNLVMIGAPDTVTTSGQTGTVHFFEWDGLTWSENYNYAPYATSSTQNMGKSVAIWGNIAVAGSPTSTINPLDTGNVYVFQQYTSPGGAWTNTQVLRGSDYSSRPIGPFPHSNFGASVAMDNEWLLVGYPGYSESPSFTSSGKVYYYKKTGANTLSFNTTGSPTSAAYNNNYGKSVDIYRNPATGNGYGIVADDSNAYVNTVTNSVWSLNTTYKLLSTYSNNPTNVSINPRGDVFIGNSINDRGYINKLKPIYTTVSNATIDKNGASGSQFGSSIAISGSKMAIGASTLGGNGTVCLYSADNTTISSWSNTSNLSPSGLNTNCNNILYGSAVDSTPSWLVVGAYKYSTPTAVGLDGFECGNVYVYNNTNNALTQTILPPTTPSYGYFGKSLSIESNTMVVGAPGQSTGSQIGNVYIYNWNGSSWIQNSNVLQTSGISSQFGNVVKIRNNCIAVADTGNDTVSYTGNVYAYKDGNWSGASDRLIGSDVTLPSDKFGFDIAMSDKFIAVGTSKLTNGNVYIFQRDTNGFGIQVSPGVFNESSKIVNSEASIGSFGAKLSFNESLNILAIGAVDSTNLKNKIYLYKFNTGPKYTASNTAWSLLQSITYTHTFPVLYAPNSLIFKEKSLLFGNVQEYVKAYYYTPEYDQQYRVTLDTDLASYFYSDWAKHTAITGTSTAVNLSSTGGLRVHGELAGNVVISKNGYLYFNDVPFVSMLEPLCGFPFDNAYYRQSSNTLTVTMSNTANTVVVQANMFLTNNRYAESMSIVYNTLSGLSSVSNTYSALSHTIYNDISAAPINYNSNAITVVFNNPSAGITSNIQLLQSGDIVKLTSFNQFKNNGLFDVLDDPISVGSSYYLPVRNTGFDTEEYYNTNANLNVNEFRTYVIAGPTADINFQDVRGITGNASNFLRFAKLRDEGLENSTGSSVGNANVMEKSLNFAVTSWDNSNVITDYSVYLRERVPNEVLTSNTYSQLYGGDHYIVALGTPVPDFGSNIELEYQNINTGPIGYLHNFVYRNLANVGSIFSSTTYNLTGNIVISGDTITLSGINHSGSGVIDVGRWDAGYNDPINKPFQHLKPGMLLKITDNGSYSANIMVANVTVGNDGEYLTISRDSRYNGVNINASWNFTPGQLDIKFLDDYTTSFPRLVSAQVISDRYNFAAVPYNPEAIPPRYNYATMYLAKLPISGILLLASVTGTPAFHSPDYFMEPNRINQPLDSITEDDTNIVKCLPYGLNSNLNNKKLIEDTGNHTLLIPTSELNSNGYQNIIYMIEYSATSTALSFVTPGVILNTGTLTSPFTNLRKGSIFEIVTPSSGAAYYQVSLTQDPTTNTIYLNTDFNPNASKIPAVSTPATISCRGFGSIDTNLANLGYFQPGQKIIVSRTIASIDGVYIINRDVPTADQFISVTDGPILGNDILRFCALEKCMFGDEEYPLQYPAGSNTNVGTGGQPLLNIPSGTSNLLATFSTGDTIQIYDTGIAGVNGTWTVSPNLAITPYSLPIDGGITTGSNIPTAFFVTKDIALRIIGKAISTLTDSGIVKFHYTDAQGNNLMLGSFTGQFAGATALSIQNVFIGNKVGQTNQGSGNILIGNETGFALSAEDGATSYDNKFAVYKNNFIGVPSNPLIGGDFASNRVGINTINPDALLTAQLDTVTRLIVNGRARAQAFTTFTGVHFITLADDGQVAQPGHILVSTGSVQKQALVDTIVQCRLSNRINEKAVYGIYAGQELGARGDIIHQCASVGEGQILVCNIGGEPENGDYIASSPIPGYGQLQSDDLLHNYTVAKLTEDIDWSMVSEYVWYDGVSYKCTLAACTYHCG